MAKPVDNSALHRRTRRDHSTETAEDYVEAIAETIRERGVCRGADLAKLFGVSNVTITKLRSWHYWNRIYWLPF